MAVLYLILGVACVALDQWVKYWTRTVLMNEPGGTIPIIEDVFHLTYVENRGAAFGMLQGQKWLFVVLTVAMVIAFCVYLFWKKPGWLPGISMGMVIGGAIGNLIDRVMLGYVVDLFDFRLINFAVFNVADVFIVVGMILLAWWILFLMDKEKKHAPSAPETEENETAEHSPE